MIKLFLRIGSVDDIYVIFELVILIFGIVIFLNVVFCVYVILWFFFMLDKILEESLSKYCKGMRFSIGDNEIIEGMNGVI